MKSLIEKFGILICIFYLCILLSATPVSLAEPSVFDVTGHFAPELTPGSNFTWTVNEWYKMDGWINPQSQYTPQPGDKWRLMINEKIPSITLTNRGSEVTSNYDIMGWHIESFDFPTLDSKESSQLNISGHNFFEVFGNESDDSQHWRMFLQLFVVPLTIEDENGEEEDYGQFRYAQLENIVAYTDVNISKGVLKLRGTISEGNYSIDINFECRLGLRQQFYYKKTQILTQEVIGIVNISLIESEFGPLPPKNIPGFSYLIGISSLYVGIVTVIVSSKIKNRGMK